MAITTTIPTNLDFPNRGVLERDAFVNAQETAQDLLAGAYTTALNQYATELNSTQAEINLKAEQVYNQAVDGGYSQVYIDSTYMALTGNQTIAGVKTFSSNIVGSITGNSGTATKLATSKTINGVSFDGSANISVGLDSQGPVLTTALTLNATHKNKVLPCSGTFNIALPTVSTTKSGDLFIIDNIGTGTLSLVTNGNNTDLSRLTVLAGEVLILQSDGGSYYRFVSRSKDFASNINVSAGYTYLPNGLLMQWGRTTTNIAPAATLNITFPVAFPVECFYSDMAIVTVSPSNGLYVPYVVATSPSNLAITNNDTDSTITQIRWFAIGF